MLINSKTRFSFNFQTFTGENFSFFKTICAEKWTPLFARRTVWDGNRTVSTCTRLVANCMRTYDRSFMRNEFMEPPFSDRNQFPSWVPINCLILENMAKKVNNFAKIIGTTVDRSTCCFQFNWTSIPNRRALRFRLSRRQNANDQRVYSGA